jgi:hypothetical protein
MQMMDCNELKVPDRLVVYCRQDDASVISRIFKCCFDLFFEDFKRIYWNKCVNGSVLYSVEEQLMTAFVLGESKFYGVIRLKGWEDRGATVRTALFTYCFNQLRALTKFIRSHPGNEYGGDPDVMITAKKTSLSFDFSDAEKEAEDFEYEIYTKAFSELNERCKDFIRWGRLQEISDDQIKKKYPNVNFESRDPTDITFRCVQSLKKIIERLRRKK